MVFQDLGEVGPQGVRKVAIQKGGERCLSERRDIRVPAEIEPRELESQPGRRVVDVLREAELPDIEASREGEPRVVAPANPVIDVHDCAWIDGVDGIHRDVVVVTVLRTVAGRGPRRGEAVQRLAVTVLVGAARPQAELLGKAVIEAAIEFVVARR